jgi:dTDP-glucose pyrophosphorylase
MTPQTTIRQCAILAGGLGTRLGALTANTPKPILPVGGRPFLGWLMREISRYGIEEILLLSGHLSEKLRESVDEIAANLPRKLTIRYSEEPVRAGTGGALFHARHLLDDRFLLLNGDSLLDFNLATLLAQAALDPPEIIGRLAIRPVPDASRYGQVTTSADHITAFQPRPPENAPPGPGWINAGVYLFRRDILDHATSICSLEADILPFLATSGRLRATQAAGYFIDIGIPTDFARAQTELPAALKRPASNSSQAPAKPSRSPPPPAGTSSSSPTNPASPAASTPNPTSQPSTPGSPTKSTPPQAPSTTSATAPTTPKPHSKPTANRTPGENPNPACSSISSPPGNSIPPDVTSSATNRPTSQPPRPLICRRLCFNPGGWTMLFATSSKQISKRVLF